LVNVLHCIFKRPKKITQKLQEIHLENATKVIGLKGLVRDVAF